MKPLLAVLAEFVVMSEYTTAYFIDLATKVAKLAGFNDPAKAYWQCSDFSIAAAITGGNLGIPVELWSCEVLFKHDNKEIKKGEKVGHTFLKIGNNFYDFTARQADADVPLPYIFKKAPDNYSKVKKIKTPAETTSDAEFYYKMFWDEIDQ